MSTVDIPTCLVRTVLEQGDFRVKIVVSDPRFTRPLSATVPQASVHLNDAASVLGEERRAGKLHHKLKIWLLQVNTRYSVEPFHVPSSHDAHGRARWRTESRPCVLFQDQNVHRSA